MEIEKSVIIISVIIFLLDYVTCYKKLQCNPLDRSYTCILEEYGEDVNLTDVKVTETYDEIIRFGKLSVNYIPMIIKSIPMMKSFDIYDCGEIQFYPGMFTNLTRLEYLSITNCIIEEIGPNTFKDASNLKELHLDSNGIQSIDPDAFRGLKSLNELSIISNNLKYLDPKIFQDLYGMWHLDLSQNKIEKLDEGLFDSNGNLGYIRLNKNLIKYIFPFLFDNLRQMPYLSLNDNDCVDDTFDHPSLDEFYEGIENCVGEKSDEKWWEKFKFVRSYHDLKRKNLALFTVIIFIAALSLILIAALLAVIVKIKMSRKPLYKPPTHNDSSDDSILDEHFVNRQNSQTQRLIADFE
jgi:hypothetical protein